MQRRHSDKPVTKPPIELPLRKNYSVIETAKSRPRPKSNQSTAAAATISASSAAASNLPPPPVVLQQPQKPQMCQKNSIAEDSIAEDLLISFDPPPKGKNPLFEEIENLYSEPVNSLSHVMYQYNLPNYFFFRLGVSINNVTTFGGVDSHVTKYF